MSSQQNCDTVNNMNNKAYTRTMSLDPYQNKLPIVDYGLPNIGGNRPVNQSNVYSNIATSSMLKGYMSQDGSNPNPLMSDTSNSVGVEMQQAYSEGGRMEKVDLSKYTETNTCNLDVSGQCQNPGFVTPQQNSEVLPGAGSLMTPESSRNLFPISQYRGMTFNRWDSWKMNEPLNATTMLNVTSTRVDTKNQLESLASLRKEIKNKLEQKKANLMKQKMETAKKEMMNKMSQDVNNYKAAAMEQAANQNAYYRSIIQASVARNIDEERREMERRNEAAKKKNKKLFDEKTRQLILQGNQQYKQRSQQNNNKASNNVQAYSSKNTQSMTEELSQMNKQYESQFNNKINDILANEFDSMEQDLKNGLFAYDSVSNLQASEENNVTPYGENELNPYINNV
jgi:hypothetical protein